MKHSLKITLVLLVMFFITQLIGILVFSIYSPITKQVIDENGNIKEIKVYNLPFGMEPPQDIQPKTALTSIIFALVFATAIILLLMKFKFETFLRLWFFVVVTLALAITLNSFLINFQNSSLIALIIALPFSFYKIFKRNTIVHNLTELFIYPGIATIFVPLLNIWTIVLLLILISLYDMYAVWHSGFMQKMAKYQIEKVKVFSGFFIPYIGKKERQIINDAKQSGSKKLSKKIKVNVAILGGGDVVFPMILSGVMLYSKGIFGALSIAIGATLALAVLFYFSKKGKFYPAMPFISAGCLLALGIYLLL